MDTKFSQRFYLILAIILIFCKGNTAQYSHSQYAFGRRLPYPFQMAAVNNLNSNFQGQGQGHCCNCSKIPHTHPQLLLTTTPSPPPPPPQPQSINYPFSPISPQKIPSYLMPSFSDDRSAVHPFPHESNMNIQKLTPNGNANVIDANPNANSVLPNGNTYNVNVNMNQIPTSPVVGNNFGGDHLNLDTVIHFKLFTREFPVDGEVLKVNNEQLLNASKFLVSRPTKFILHGFADGNEEKIGDWVSAMKTAFLSASDSNVIVVDYSHFSGYLYFWDNVPFFASSKLADMMYFLEGRGAKMGDFHVVGRLWGAHIAGMTGRMCQGKLGRISGLEPGAPSANVVGHEFQLDFTDAQFVDIVHVNGKRFFFHGTRFGLVPPTGHVDIYPNFAEKSSGCPDEKSNFRSFSFRSCKRGRGVKYFVDTIQYPYAHPICLCPSFQTFKSGECYCGQQNTITMGQINNQTVGIFQLAAAPLNTLQRNLIISSRLHNSNSARWG